MWCSPRGEIELEEFSDGLLMREEVGLREQKSNKEYLRELDDFDTFVYGVSQDFRAAFDQI